MLDFFHFQKCTDHMKLSDPNDHKIGILYLEQNPIQLGGNGI